MCFLGEIGYSLVVRREVIEVDPILDIGPEISVGEEARGNFQCVSDGFESGLLGGRFSVRISVELTLR